MTHTRSGKRSTPNVALESHLHQRDTNADAGLSGLLRRHELKRKGTRSFRHGITLSCVPSKERGA